ncbi:NAD-dependent protein deacetylase [Salinispira pacifica]
MQPSAGQLSDHSQIDDLSVEGIVGMLRGRSTAVLSGAGMSTESGIPDYRGPDGPRRKAPPIQYRDFVVSATTRTRYWARSAIGWQHFSRALPNAAHYALARLESAGLVSGVITQNVDRLHQAAGSDRVVELHGAIAEVVCLDCGTIEPRSSLQRRIIAMNPGWETAAAAVAPDGDADLPEELVDGFRTPVCLNCAGRLKPNVVLFGENVPKGRVDTAFEMVDRADALLVAGSSLTVYSGFRFVDRAAKRGIPVAIVNIGATRGDPLAAARMSARLGAVLPRIAGELLDAPPTVQESR